MRLSICSGIMSALGSISPPHLPIYDDTAQRSCRSILRHLMMPSCLARLVASLTHSSSPADLSDCTYAFHCEKGVRPAARLNSPSLWIRVRSAATSAGGGGSGANLVVSVLGSFCALSKASL